MRMARKSGFNEAIKSNKFPFVHLFIEKCEKILSIFNVPYAKATEQGDKNSTHLQFRIVFKCTR